MARRWTVAVLMAAALAPTCAAAGAMRPVQEQQASAAAPDADREARRRAEWALLRAQRMQPLAVPSTQDPQAWANYTEELVGRLTEDETGLAFYWTLTMLDDSAAYDADAIRGRIREMAQGTRSPDRALFDGPDSRRLATVIVDALQAVPPASLQGDTLVFVGTREAFARIEPAAARTGLGLQFVDATVPYPGKPGPETPPDWFEGSDD